MKKIPKINSSLEDLESSFQGMDDRLFNVTETTTLVKPIKDELLNTHVDYAIKDLFAKGGIKNIFRTYHSKTGRFVAMAKLRDKYSDSEEQQERFLREARITAYLSHPNIIPVYAIGFHEEKPFFSMKLIHGDSLSTLITNLAKGKKSYRNEYGLNDLLDIFLKVCEAVAYAHSRGVVHLDIKPDNIRVNRFGEVLLCDWGLARIIREPEVENHEEEAILLDADLHNEITLTGTLKGTPGYMAPEQINPKLGEKVEQTDIYSLGCLLYKILTFQRPLKEHSDLEKVLNKTKRGEILSPSELCPRKNIPAGLEAICLQAMHRRQIKRYKDVETLTDDIRAYRQGFATSAEQSGLLKEAILLLKRHKVVTGFFFSIFLICNFFIYNLYQKEQHANRNLELYQQEKEMAEYFNQAGIDSILRNFHSNFRSNSTLTNLKIADYILKKNPENKRAMGLKGMTLLAVQRYKESEYFLQKSQKYPEILEACQKMKLGGDHFDLLKTLYMNGHSSLAAQFVEHAFSKDISLEKKNLWLKRHYFICNPKIKKESSELSYTEDEDSTVVIFGDGKTRVENLSFMGHLPIKHLVLKDLKFFSSFELDYSKLESLTFINCQDYTFWRLDGIRHLKEINFINSKEIDLTKYKLKDVKINRH